MIEKKDSLQLIQDGLNAPIEKVEPAAFDDEQISRVMAARSKPIVYPPFSITRNKKLNEKDETLKGNTEE